MLLRATFILFIFLITGCIKQGNDNSEPYKKNTSNDKMETDKQPLTEEQIKQKISATAYRVARKSGTEQPFGEAYDNFKKEGKGDYHCIVCDQKLFSSNSKFDARCGWPAFFESAAPNTLLLEDDYSTGSKRIEVKCRQCNSHLGHLFEGEGFATPTNKRYCINAVVLKFYPAKN